MKPALAAAGLIAPREAGSNWGWEPSREMMHQRWRHTYASVQLHAGEDVVSVSLWMGHDSPVITLRVYAHFMPDHGQRGRTAVDAWLASSAHGAPPPVVDLSTVAPLAFREFVPLTLPDTSSTDGPVVLYVPGGRYGCTWALGAQREPSDVLLGRSAPT